MDRDTLRKVQYVQLEIAKEIFRICADNGLACFLDSGSMLGAVRHNGFIPWDDDLDIGMMRDDYEKFTQIVSDSLKDEYYWQDWENDDSYPLCYGKVRKKGTIYRESKSDIQENCGIYVDVFPYDCAPSDRIKQLKILKKQCFIQRCLLMKSHYKPWVEIDRIVWKKRIGYVPYKIVSMFMKRNKLISEYCKTYERKNGDMVYENCGWFWDKFYEKKWFDTLIEMQFEDAKLLVPEFYDKILTVEYGDYMIPPPISERENRHQIYEIVL